MATLFPHPAPELPPFHTFLLQGSYHASAPIYLMLSQNWQNPKAKAIFISPSRGTFLSSLIKSNDEWLKVHSGEGRTCDASSRIENYYSPTQTHLVLLLNMLHVYSGTLYNPKTTLPEVPTLVVLHDISALLKLATTATEPTLSSYLSLISHALATVRSLSAQGTTEVALAVFDAGLDTLRLPIIRPVSPSGEEAGSLPSPARRESVAFFVEKYFEWVGRVEASQNQYGSEGSMRMTIHRMRDGEDTTSDIVCQWVVATRVVGPNAGTKYFSWS